MAWCPKCRNEYREGIEECADCHVPLVEELPPEEEDSGNEFDGGFEDWVKAHPEMLQKIKESQEEKNVAEEGTPGIENRKLQVYRSSAQRAEEFKSSAWTLLIVGVAGLATMILIMLGIIPIHFAANVKYLSYGVMSALFAAFIVTGVRSFDSAKKYAKAACEEEALTEEIHTWFMKSFSREDLDCDGIADEEERSEALLYYSRIEKIRQSIQSKYMELDESYLNKIADDFFHEIYE